MLKYWLIGDNENHLIAITENSIYSGNVNKIDKSKLTYDLKQGLLPENIFNIPFSHIRSVENPQGKKAIIINYGDDLSEELKTKDVTIRAEIFNHLRSNLSKFEYSVKTPSKFEHARPQILAILIVTGLYIWAWYLANEISKGYEYIIVGGRPGITSVILGIAQFGTLKLTLGYILILFIAAYSLGKRLESRSLTEYLTRIKN